MTKPLQPPWRAREKLSKTAPYCRMGFFSELVSYSESMSAGTEILRLRLRMTVGAGRKSRNSLASPLGEEGHVVAQGCTTLQAGLRLYAALTANRQPSRRLVFTTDCLICFEYQDSSLTLRMTVSGGKFNT